MIQRHPSLRPRLLFWGIALLLFTAGCTASGSFEIELPIDSGSDIETTNISKQITISADGEQLEIETTAATVRDALEEAAIETAASDEVTPPLFTPLTDRLEIEIVRVTESVETIEQSIPFERKIVRNETMAADDPPRILQAGKAGLEQLTVRIVYRDGIETERRVTQIATLEEQQDEIVMIGIDLATSDIATFPGRIAFINGGSATLLESSSAQVRQLDTGEGLDRRVFQLSPDGDFLLYTRVPTDTTSADFNSLWVISTARNADPRPLGINNILWADWNPAQSGILEIAYTTGEPTSLPPGWEANNDLWLGNILRGNETEFEPLKIVDSYPATYGWWGGNYKWAPTGEYIAYSYADEVGIINMLDDSAEFRPRLTLTDFVEYDTQADWVWVPSLTWSPDGRYIAFTRHSGDRTDSQVFDSWIVDIFGGANGRIQADVGIWSHPHWSPSDGSSQPITFLRSTDPFDSIRSSYALWAMDVDGSNARQIYPPAGENTFFPRIPRFLAWQGDGPGVAFVFDDDLFLLNAESGQVSILSDEEASASHPTWAPYGAGLNPIIIESEPTPTPEPNR